MSSVWRIPCHIYRRRKDLHLPKLAVKLYTSSVMTDRASIKHNIGSKPSISIYGKRLVYVERVPGLCQSGLTDNVFYLMSG